MAEEYSYRKAYLHGMNAKYPFLTAEKESEAVKTLAGDELKDFLVNHNTVVAIMRSASKKKAGPLDKDDFCSIVVSGLRAAVESYDPGCGVRFIEYADPFIDEAIENSVTRQEVSAYFHDVRLDMRLTSSKGGESNATMADLVVGNIDPTYLERGRSEAKARKMERCSSMIDGMVRGGTPDTDAFRAVFFGNMTVAEAAAKLGVGEDEVRASIARVSERIRGKLVGVGIHSFEDVT